MHSCLYCYLATSRMEWCKIITATTKVLHHRKPQHQNLPRKTQFRMTRLLVWSYCVTCQTLAFPSPYSVTINLLVTLLAKLNKTLAKLRMALCSSHATSIVLQFTCTYSQYVPTLGLTRLKRSIRMQHSLLHSQSLMNSLSLLTAPICGNNSNTSFRTVFRINHSSVDK